MNELVDALQFADFATAEELAQARTLIASEMGDLEISTLSAPEFQKFQGGIDLSRYQQHLDLNSLKRDSEILENKNENLEISSQFANAAWIQLKVQLTSLHARLTARKIEISEKLDTGLKRRRLSQSIHASSLRQLIREWSDFISNNGDAEIAVAKLTRDVQHLANQFPDKYVDEVNSLVVLD